MIDPLNRSPSVSSTLLTFALPLVLLLPSGGRSADRIDTAAPIVPSGLTFLEIDGVLAVEAEHFFEQTHTEKRAFHITTSEKVARVDPDGDPSHVAGASGGAYIECLPDTRRTHADRLIPGENFSNEPGKLAVLSYHVEISTPGRFYVWARAFSTGGEDNGLHVGLDGEWPESGQRLQWCEGKNGWRWESKQRTAKQHCGEPRKIYLDIAESGEHTIHFSMREDGFEFDRWLITRDPDFVRPEGIGPSSRVASAELPKAFPYIAPEGSDEKKRDSTGKDSARDPATTAKDAPAQVLPRGEDGDGSVSISGERRLWHKITLSLDGPWAHERDNAPNPFVDLEFSVVFRHESGAELRVPGYFAADGDAAETSAESGTTWRAHLAPDRTGEWSYRVEFVAGGTSVRGVGERKPLAPYHGKSGSFVVAASDKSGRDLRAHGRLAHVGARYLRFAGSGEWFLKAGADAPETLLGYADFDGTVAGRPAKVPLKTWTPHVRDWRDGDPTWKGDKGKGLIGAINYLSAKGMNAFSFLTYNAGGDGDNVWPFIERDEKLHYDASKLDQWGIVFDHGTRRGMYLHFKLQETEIDDERRGKEGGRVPEALDGGALGIERRLYCREIVARFAHELALNWNLGEENTQSTEEQMAMASYLAELDAYDHLIVVHTYPGDQDRVYRPLLGGKSALRGASLQNSHIRDTHWQTVKWVRESTAAGVPWVIAFDESGTAAHGQCPDLGYRGFDGHDRSGKMIYTEHEVRRQTLWGTLMGGGAGVEYYFGYQFDENDLICEDWRSRDRSWDYCRIALEFFRDEKIPFWTMAPADELVGNSKHDNSRYCLASDEVYLVYLPTGGSVEVDLSTTPGTFSLRWFHPREGGQLTTGRNATVPGGGKASIAAPDEEEDWLAVLRRVSS